MAKPLKAIRHALLDEEAALSDHAQALTEDCPRARLLQAAAEYVDEAVRVLEEADGVVLEPGP
jgi:hypothetical protein